MKFHDFFCLRIEPDPFHNISCRAIAIAQSGPGGVFNNRLLFRIVINYLAFSGIMDSFGPHY
jgi:hypothetical protein